MDDNLAAQMADMLVDMTTQPDLQSTLDRICDHALKAASADAAGIVLLQSGRLQTVAATDQSIYDTEKVQTAAGQGPSLETVWEQVSVHVPDVRAERRWPRWSALMVELGWMSTLNLCLFGNDNHTLGSLVLCARAPDAFDAEVIEVAQIFSQNASVAMAAAREEHQLIEAISARHLIGVAQGVLMQRYGLEMEAAFDVLKRYSQDRNVRLRDVAAHVVRSHELPRVLAATPTPQA